MGKSSIFSGNLFEEVMCEILSKDDFFVLRIPKSNSGSQAGDIIAVRSKVAYLIDCKHCHGDTFNKSRIEENQHTAMSLWLDTGNTMPVFAIKIRDEVFMVDYDVICFEIKKSLSYKHMKESKYYLSYDEWVRGVL